MRIWLLLVICFLPSPGWSGPPVAYQAEIAHSAAWFEVGYWPRSKVKGRLAMHKGWVALDEGGKNGRGEILFDMNSVQTGSDVVNDFVKSRQIFDTANYPVMSFRPHRFEYQGEQLLATEGELMLHGVTRAVRLSVKRLVCADSLSQVLPPAVAAEGEAPQAGKTQPLLSTAATGQTQPGLGRAFCHGEFATSILRSQFGMDNLSWMVDDEVHIAVNLLLQRVSP